VQNGGTIQSAFCILITVLAELAYVMLHIMNRIFLFTKLGSTFFLCATDPPSLHMSTVLLCLQENKKIAFKLT